MGKTGLLYCYEINFSVLNILQTFTLRLNYNNYYIISMIGPGVVIHAPITP